jgi:hypothetical protein
MRRRSNGSHVYKSLDLEERYCEIAARRMSQGVLDLQPRFSELMGTAMRDADEAAEEWLR